jgi:lysozyme family protein
MAESRYTPAFRAAFAQLMVDEGGYVSAARARHVGDSGGETKYGISKAEYPDLDIANLTLAAAEEIYWRDYWSTSHFDSLPDQVAQKTFNLSVVMGQGHAIRCLQRAAGDCHFSCAVDGVLGAKTIAAVHAASAPVIMPELRNRAAEYFRAVAITDPEEADNLEGWLNRAYA